MEQPFFRRTFSLRNCFRAFLILLAFFAALITAKTWWDGRVFAGYDPEVPLDAEVLSTAELKGYTTEKIAITGLTGERIPLRIIRPKMAAGEKAPCVVFLYGIGQSSRFFDQIAPLFAANGFVMAMPEQFQCGERRSSKIGTLRKLSVLRERSSRIVPETRRVVDFLSQDPGIDSGSMHLMGASYGGITGCSVMAHEPRFQNAVLIMAGGNLPKMLDALVRRYRPESQVLGPAVAALAAWVMSPFEPLNFIGKISPRPLLFLDVADDELIATECTDALYNTAGNPKDKLTYGGGHDSISEEVVLKMLDDSMNWLKKSGSLPPTRCAPSQSMHNKLKHSRAF